jgi:hypothetical protein
MSLKVTGKLISKGEIQTVGQKGFQKREFVIELDDAKYPQKVKFSLLSEDYTKLIDEYAEGEKIAVDFNLKGNEWNGKLYNDLVAWRIEAVSLEKRLEKVSKQVAAAGVKEYSQKEIEEGDLPF